MEDKTKVFARATYDLLSDEGEGAEDSAMSFQEFVNEWEEWGMLIAIYNLGWMNGGGA